MLIRPMFGGRAVDVGGCFILDLTAKEEPWRGVLVPSGRAHQPSLMADFPALTPHSILPKWLYLPEAAGSFERDVAELIGRIGSGDPRIGIEPAPRHPRAKARPGKRRAKRD